MGVRMNVQTPIDYIRENEELRKKILHLENIIFQKMEDKLLKSKTIDSLGILAGGIAHDFNNLLAVILGNISLVKLMPYLDHKILIHLERAEEAITQAKTLTNRLLTFSKGGSPIYKTISIEKLIQNVVSMTVNNPNITCRFELASELWPVLIDETQIGIAIRNVIINAIEAMPTGGTILVTGTNISITKPVSLDLSPQKYVKISFKDEGTGIEEEHLGNIFTPYFTTKSVGQEKGIGLGLPITYSIMKKHGGIIDVQSQKNKGTCVDFYFPVAPDSSEKPIEPVDSKPCTNNSSPCRILFMDDEQCVREMFKQMAEELGYSCQVAANGDEAIRLYHEAREQLTPYNIVILDLTVKRGLGGKNTVLRLKEIDPDVCTIVTSGFLFDDVIEEYKRYGFKAVLPKPFSFMELKNILTEVAGK